MQLPKHNQRFEFVRVHDTGGNLRYFCIHNAIVWAEENSLAIAVFGSNVPIIWLDVAEIETVEYTDNNCRFRLKRFS